MARPRVLVTGFGPFPGAPENPSAWLAETLAAQPPALEFEVELHARVLPTAWTAVDLMPRLYDTLQPQVMIHFGVSQRAKSFRIERSAHNHAALRQDADGMVPPGSMVLPEGPHRHDTQLSAAALVAHLGTSGLAAVSSRSAGSYVCNYLYYHSLDWVRRQTDPRVALFVHIPPPASQGGPFSNAALLRGAQETLRFVLAFATAQAPLAPSTGPAFAGSEVMVSAKDA